MNQGGGIFCSECMAFFTDRIFFFYCLDSANNHFPPFAIQGHYA